MEGHLTGDQGPWQCPASWPLSSSLEYDHVKVPGKPPISVERRIFIYRDFSCLLALILVRILPIFSFLLSPESRSQSLPILHQGKDLLCLESPCPLIEIRRAFLLLFDLD